MESENKLTPRDKLQFYYVGISIVSIFFLVAVTQFIIDYNENGFVSLEDNKLPELILDEYQIEPNYTSVKVIDYSDGTSKILIQEVNE